MEEKGESKKLFRQDELAHLGGLQGVEHAVVGNVYRFAPTQQRCAGHGCGLSTAGWAAAWLQWLLRCGCTVGG
jgi:hypothetical protein